MTKPMIRIHDLATDEVIDREMTAEEFAAYEADQLLTKKANDEAAKKELDRAAILEKLGLTQDEANLLLS
jgi:hypothetical protein